MTPDALRGAGPGKTGVSPAGKKVSRSGRQRGTEATRVSREEIVALAEAAVLPEGVTDVRMTTRHEQGDKLPNGDWSGLGGRTKYGPAWVLGGRLESDPVHLFDSMKDALAMFAVLAGQEGELWQRKQRRIEAIAAAEAAEAAAAEIARDNARTVRRANEGGGGSSRRSTSSETTSASTGTHSGGRRERLRQASRTTASPSPSS